MSAVQYHFPIAFAPITNPMSNFLCWKPFPAKQFLPHVETVCYWLVNLPDTWGNSGHSLRYGAIQRIKPMFYWTHGLWGHIVSKIAWNEYKWFTGTRAAIQYKKIQMASYQYRKSDCGDKTILWLSYLHNGISYTGKTTSLYWIGALFP